jgi:hypothetical protein
MTMDIEEIKKEVIYSDSQSRLFEISVELTEEISILHIELVKAKDFLDKTVIKGKISVLCALQNIVDKRMEDPKIFLKGNSERKELLTNRQFRIAAEMVLTKETYDRIVELSVMNYKRLKDQKAELKTHKLE